MVLVALYGLYPAPQPTLKLVELQKFLVSPSGSACGEKELHVASSHKYKNLCIAGQPILS
jgi:hypothetical protein